MLQEKRLPINTPEQIDEVLKSFTEVTQTGIEASQFSKPVICR